MTIFGLPEVFGLAMGEMAKSRGTKKTVEHYEGVTRPYVDRLVRSGTNRPAFEAILAEIKGDERLAAADVVAIAHQYARSSKRPSSKATAYAAISKRFVELVRFESKNRVAEKTRPW